jgi:diacylglycerol kinase (ATP)
MSATDTTRQPRAAVVYNPIKIDLDAVRAVVDAEEEAAGWPETLWFPTSEDDPGRGATTEAIDAGATLVIAAGGDGTVRAIAEVVDERGVEMALLPSGTGNLLARNMKLTLDDLEHSIHTAFTGTVRGIDLGTVSIEHGDGSTSEHAFLVMAGVGIDAKMLAATNEGLKAKIGPLAYVAAIVKALFDRNQLRLQYTLDGRRHPKMRAHTVIVGNCGTLTGNVLLLPNAVIDDGDFEIVTLRPEGLIGWGQIIVKVFWENGVLRRTALGRKFLTKEVRALNYVKGKDLRVTLSRPEQIELDGDGFGDATAFRATIKPQALRVRVPRDVAVTEDDQA